MWIFSQKIHLLEQTGQMTTKCFKIRQFQSEMQRVSINDESISTWFHDLKNYLTETKNENILGDPDLILNADETGFSMYPKTLKVH